MPICQRKPDSLGSLVAIGLDPTVQPYPTYPVSYHGDSGRRRSSASMAGGPQGMPFGRPTPMVRSSSQVVPSVPTGSSRSRSKRGEKRGTNVAAPSVNINPARVVLPSESIAARESSPAWRTSMSMNQEPEAVEREVTALLNKLTMEEFDPISDQLIAWANKSNKKKDGRTLFQVTRLLLEKAFNEATRSEMYARLCRKLMEQISPQVRDDGVRNNDGKHITGGHLFRKYILNRCQEDFERGLASNETTTTVAAANATGEQATSAIAENIADAEVALYSEDHVAQKAKRQYLGLIKFEGELFKVQMLTERIMHECIKALLGDVAAPEKEKIEALCTLLTTVGQSLDTPKARAHINVYFSRMKELVKSPYLNLRMQRMLQVSVYSDSTVYAASDLKLTLFTFRMSWSCASADGLLKLIRYTHHHCRCSRSSGAPEVAAVPAVFRKLTLRPTRRHSPVPDSDLSKMQ